MNVLQTALYYRAEVVYCRENVVSHVVIMFVIQFIIHGNENKITQLLETVIDKLIYVYLFITAITELDWASASFLCHSIWKMLTQTYTLVTKCNINKLF
jgi:uncharacterized membrane protein YbjE (DUF340 family)